jgi:glycosyltransferase involved in cell wall biosynthesis
VSRRPTAGAARVTTHHVVFYGHFAGASSFPVVCRAVTKWLVENGRSPWFCDLRQPSYQQSADLEQELRGVSRVSDFTQAKIVERMKALQQGYAIPRDDIETNGIALLFGFPEWAWACPTHRVFIGYHVCDVDRVPEHWVRAINEVASHVLTPSRWCAQVMKRCGVQKRIQVVRHGIDPAVFTPTAVDTDERLGGPCYSGSPWRSRGKLPAVRFFCSSPTGTRKGLHEVIAAWRIVGARGTAPPANLIVRGSGPAVISACRDAPNVVVEQGEPMRAMTMARTLRATDLLLAPSRAEGFGLCPIEALSCGTPAVVTDCTGHAEWARTIPKGTRIVETGDMAPCPPGPGLAPSLDVVHLADVIEAALVELPILQQEALDASPKVRQRWSWNNALTGSALDKLTAEGEPSKKK